MVCGLVAIVCLVSAKEGSAQSPSTGALRGVVMDSAGEGLTAVLVRLVDTETGLPREITSDREGRYRFGLLPAGEYQLRVEKLGYAPVVLRRVVVSAGGERRLDIGLPALRGTNAIAADEREAEGHASTRPGASESVAAWALRTLPFAERQAGELSRLVSRADREMGLDGLPYWLTSVVVDGTLFRAARHPLYGGGSAESAVFPLSALAGAEVITAAADIEFASAAGGWLNLHALRGTSATQGSAFLAGSPPIATSVDNAPGDIGAQGSLSVRLPAGDSARLSAGLDVRRLRMPVTPAWGANPTAATLATLSESYGIDFVASTRPGLVESDAVTGHLRFDWNLAERHQLGGWAFASMQPQMMARNGRTLLPQNVEGKDVIGGASLTSVLGPTTFNDLRISVTSSTRETAEPAAAGPAFVVSDDFTIGGLRSSASGTEGRFTLADALHVTGARHTLKIGAGVSVVAREYGYLAGSDGEVYFGGLDDVLARRGLTVRNDATAPGAEWQTVTPLLFVQDRIELGEGLAVEAGVRAERWKLPQDEVTRDTEWQDFSGLANDSVDASGWYADVRGSLTWDVQRTGAWLLQANAGVFHDEIDPLLVAQWQMDAGTARVRREFGSVRWPEDPAAGGTFRRVTLLGPGFAPPRTVRGGAGLSFAPSAGTMLQVSGTVRRTETLPRRTDLNLLPSASYRDQYGRAVFGTPVKSGALVAATPGTGRRLADYDEAAGVNADGWSEHWGITLGVERELSSAGAIALQYTFSRARDNWFGAREGGWTVAPPVGLETAEEWAEGTSDFDVPHRLAAVLSLALPMNARLTSVYRMESGLPFTPGFRRGVDANADGYMGNDPAFVDGEVAGVSSVVADWSCLEDSRGSFAERNSCRGPMEHALDASLRMDMFSVGGAAAGLSLDVFDVLASARAPRDAALYLVDAAAALTINNTSRTVTVPLVVNPNFGEEVVRPHPGRTIRLSLHVTW